MTSFIQKQLSVSIVLCCYNSAQRLPETLKHVSNQIVCNDILWEILVIDNGSNDLTSQTAKNILSLNPHIPFKIIYEPKSGLANARIRGFIEASCDIISFIDDDNWICPTWIKTLSAIMTSDNMIGACGGLNTAVAETDLPWWFDKFSRSYAVGPQGKKNGDITNENGVIFGAGMSIRKSAWNHLIANNFKLTLSGRKGSTLLCGEDYEICLALKLSGWKIWYDSRLQLNHFIEQKRLKWNYLRSMLRSVGITDIMLRPYHLVLSKSCSGRHMKWQWFTIKILVKLARYPIKVMSFSLIKYEGDPDIIQIERYFGQLKVILQLRNQYRTIIKNIDNAGWLSKKHR